jgi:hypothetical protein
MQEEAPNGIATQRDLALPPNSPIWAGGLRMLVTAVCAGVVGLIDAAQVGAAGLALPLPLSGGIFLIFAKRRSPMPGWHNHGVSAWIVRP